MVKSETSHTSYVTSASCPTASHAADMLVPLHTTLPDGRHVTVSPISEHQLSDVYALIQEAARNSDGFGFDEFPTEADFRREMHDGKYFQICLQEPCRLIAVLLITDSRFYRGQAVADPWIMVQAGERRRGVGEFCFRLCLDVCRRLGYRAIYADTFANNVAMRKILEKFGFQRVGWLPMGGTLHNGTVVSSVIYYKDIRPGHELDDVSERDVISEGDVIDQGNTGNLPLEERTTTQQDWDRGAADSHQHADSAATSPQHAEDSNQCTGNIVTSFGHAETGTTPYQHKEKVPNLCQHSQVGTNPHQYSAGVLNPGHSSHSAVNPSEHSENTVNACQQGDNTVNLTQHPENGVVNHMSAHRELDKLRQHIEDTERL